MLVEPTLSLGEQWPKNSLRGFQKVIPGQRRKVRAAPASSTSSPSSTSDNKGDQVILLFFFLYICMRVINNIKTKYKYYEYYNKVKPLYAMTARLAETFQRHNPEYRFDGERTNTKRVLTKPSKPAMNDGFDNENCDYILKVNEILGDDKDYQYRVIDLLGQGTFGQVVKCVRISTGQLYSVKVIKNKRAYRTQSRMEVEILKQAGNKLHNSFVTVIYI